MFYVRTSIYFENVYSHIFYKFWFFLSCTLWITRWFKKFFDPERNFKHIQYYPVEALPLTISQTLKLEWERYTLYLILTAVSFSERARLIRLGHVYFLYLFMYSGLEFTLTFVTHHKHHYSSMDQGRMFTFLGLVMAVMQGGYVRRIKDGSEKSMANMVGIRVILALIFISVFHSFCFLI